MSNEQDTAEAEAEVDTTADDEAETDAEADADTESDTETETESAVIDLDAAAERDTTVEELRERVEEQQEQIEELNGLLLDLSTRVADGNDMGVCPDCHGPVMKTGGFLRRKQIKCRDCGRVFHEYRI